jgi:ABC-2 type transport system ATP-binding protein
MDSPVISLNSVNKAFNAVVAVNDVSLDVYRGEIFGLLGPNGAGKTTLIRMIMDMIRPDSGTLTLFGQPLTDEQKQRISYLPEERGLYVQQKVLFLLEYFARLKGLSRQKARSNSLALLERFNMTEHKNRKIKELSKGNQQKIQLIASLVSDPDIVILDEPFTGLDPINTRDVMNLIRDLSAAGTTILLSTHQMQLVETLCQRVFMINKGRRVLYGTIGDIRRQHSDNAVLVQSTADYKTFNMIEHVGAHNGAKKIYLREGVRPRDLLVSLVDSGVDIQTFARVDTPLEDIFIKIVQENR